MKNLFKNKKRALLSGVLAIMLLATAGLTIAFLIDKTNDVENTFTPSEVTCEVTETFKNNEKSDVYVTNTGDTDAYIRAAIVINLRDAEGNIAPVSVATAHYALDPGADWLVGADGYYYYPNVVKAGGETTNLIDSIVPTDEIPTGYTLGVEIIADAIQADGVGSATTGAVEGKDAPAEIAWSNDKVTVTVDDDTLSITNN